MGGRSALAQRRDPRELRFITAVGLTVLDPIWTASLVTLNHAYGVYDTLYGIAQDLSPRPQMVAGHTVSTDEKVWEFVLRDGLLFHDGEPVRARDAVASMKRWWRRDSFGQLVAGVTESLEAVDDKRFRLTLKQPFPHLLVALSRVGALVRGPALPAAGAVRRVHRAPGGYQRHPGRVRVLSVERAAQRMRKDAVPSFKQEPLSYDLLTLKNVAPPRSTPDNPRNAVSGE